MAKRTRRPAVWPRPVAATEAAKNFGALVNRVRESGVAYIIERKGHPIARISPATTKRCTMAELAAWVRAERALPDGYVEAVTTYVKRVNRPRVPSARWPS
jgi:antitoxin (DNA-binding transcriptional repressor) of toxin-antitoxin stability system